jgi:hypothetical protein
MPDLIRHPVSFWIPAFAGMTTVGYLPAGLIIFEIAPPGGLHGQEKVIVMLLIEDSSQQAARNVLPYGSAAHRP